MNPKSIVSANSTTRPSCCADGSNRKQARAQIQEGRPGPQAKCGSTVARTTCWRRDICGAWRRGWKPYGPFPGANPAGNDRTSRREEVPVCHAWTDGATGNEKAVVCPDAALAQEGTVLGGEPRRGKPRNAGEDQTAISGTQAATMITAYIWRNSGPVIGRGVSPMQRALCVAHRRHRHPLREGNGAGPYQDSSVEAAAISSPVGAWQGGAGRWRSHTVRTALRRLPDRIPASLGTGLGKVRGPRRWKLLGCRRSTRSSSSRRWGADKFRIKIWDRQDGGVVYDNRLGASDDLDNADPQVLGGGSIVIHRAK